MIEDKRQYLLKKRALFVAEQLRKKQQVSWDDYFDKVRSICPQSLNMEFDFPRDEINDKTWKITPTIPFFEQIDLSIEQNLLDFLLSWIKTENAQSLLVECMQPAAKKWISIHTSCFERHFTQLASLLDVANRILVNPETKNFLALVELEYHIEIFKGKINGKDIQFISKNS